MDSTQTHKENLPVLRAYTIQTEMEAELRSIEACLTVKMTFLCHNFLSCWYDKNILSYKVK